MKNIPFHQILEHSTVGFQIAYFKAGDIHYDQVSALGAHRDDNYIFFVIEKGLGHIMVDFNEIEVKASELYYVLPKQVHRRMRNKRADGWFVAVDTALIPREYRNVLEGRLDAQMPSKCSHAQLLQFRTLLVLLTERQAEVDKTTFHNAIIRHLVESFIGMFTSSYIHFSNSEIKQSNLNTVVFEFKKLLLPNFRISKSPSYYAAKLNISEPYLNEALKKITGFTVTYWIQHEVIIEAKRLLYHSELTIKEIAHELGYEDHSYFSRMFRKVVGMPAMSFRTNQFN